MCSREWTIPWESNVGSRRGEMADGTHFRSNSSNSRNGKLCPLHPRSVRVGPNMPFPTKKKVAWVCVAPYAGRCVSWMVGCASPWTDLYPTDDHRRPQPQG